MKRCSGRRAWGGIRHNAIQLEPDGYIKETNLFKGSRFILAVSLNLPGVSGAWNTWLVEEGPFRSLTTIEKGTGTTLLE
jgi:hypothetical protein